MSGAVKRLQRVVRRSDGRAALVIDVHTVRPWISIQADDDPFTLERWRADEVEHEAGP